MRGLGGGALWALAVVACTADETRPEETAGGVPETTAVQVADDTIPPVARSGFLAARAVDVPSQINGEWPATVGVCPDQRALQILADADSVGVLIVIVRPDSGDPVMRYPVTLPDGRPPAAGTARLSVQRILYLGLAYAAANGAVELSSLERQASGRFDVRLVDAITARESRYVGAFSNLPLENWPPDLCALEGQRDSVAADTTR